MSGALSDFWRWFAIAISFGYNKSLSFQVQDYLPRSIGKKGEEAIGIPSGIGTQAALVGYESSHQCATPFASPPHAPPIPFSPMGHFRFPPGLCIKTRLIAQLLIWNWFFIFKQIKLIFTTKVVHLASFWKWGSLELGNDLSRDFHSLLTSLSSIFRIYGTHRV